MSTAQRIKCFLFIVLSLGILISVLALEWLSLSVSQSANTPLHKTKHKLLHHLIINYNNYPSCAKIHIQRLTDNYYLYSKYQKSFFTLNEHHIISVKFFIHTPNNTKFNQCVSIYSEERFQFLSNHPNRVYNISEAEVVMMNISTPIDWAYPCRTPNFKWRWIEKRYISELEYVWIRKNNSKDWCLYDKRRPLYETIYSWLDAFYNWFIKEYPNKLMFLFVNGRTANIHNANKTKLIQGAFDLRTQHFRNNLDIALPPGLMNELHFGEHMRYTNKRKNNNCTRKYFATFQGDYKTYQNHRKGKLIFWREFLQYWHSDKDGIITMGVRKKKGLHGDTMYNHTQYKYSELMLNSYFNFAPRGACVYSFRFREILYYGTGSAILIADNYVLPFDNVIDWEYHINHHSIVVINEETFEHYTKSMLVDDGANVSSKKRLFQELFLEKRHSLNQCEVQENLQTLQLYFNGVASETQTLLLAIQQRLNLFTRIKSAEGNRNKLFQLHRVEENQITKH